MSSEVQRIQGDRTIQAEIRPGIPVEQKLDETAALKDREKAQQQHREHRHRHEHRPSIDLSDHKNCCDNPPALLASSDVKHPGVWAHPKLQPNVYGLYGVAAGHKGSRRAMEDRHRIIYGKGVRGFFGVYDGHGGQEAVEVAQRKLHTYMRYGGELEHVPVDPHQAGGHVNGTSSTVNLASSQGASPMTTMRESLAAAEPTPMASVTMRDPASVAIISQTVTTKTETLPLQANGGDKSATVSAGPSGAASPQTTSDTSKMIGTGQPRSSDEMKPVDIEVKQHQDGSHGHHHASHGGGHHGHKGSDTTGTTGTGSSSSKPTTRHLHEKKVPTVQRIRPRLVGGDPFKKEIEHAFERCEEDILHHSRKYGTKDGSTAVVVWVFGDTIYCANLGDSRCVLCRNGNAVPLSRDHKPQDVEEKARIVQAGGEVRPVIKERPAFCCFKAKKVPQGAPRLWPGGFSVSRALGDIDYKDLRRGKVKVVGTLIARPDVTQTSVTRDDQFLILATDGLWDVMSNQDAVDFVMKEAKKGKVDPDRIAERMTNRAFQLGSEDNITVCIVFFTHHKSWPAE